MANEVAAQKTESLSNSEAFTNKVLREFGSNVAGLPAAVDSGVFHCNRQSIEDG